MEGEPLKVVAYFRTRSGELRASEMAQQLQRQAVQEQVNAAGYALVAAFIERENENGEAWPAYVAAVHAAAALGKGEGAPTVDQHRGGNPAPKGQSLQ